MTDSPHGEIKNRLADLMYERRISVAELAEIAGVSRPTIYDLRANRTGGIEWRTLARLCDALKCGVGTLLYYSPNGQPDNQTLVGTDD